MTAVKIYKPAKNAMSSGKAKTKHWVLIFEKQNSQYIEPVMQWTASNSTQSQVKIFFDTKEEAIDFAMKKGWTYSLAEPHQPKIKPKSYTDNFTRPV